MDNQKEVSDFSLKREECPKCGAVWLNGQHIWTGTGKVGDPEVLSNLVCTTVNAPDCINKSYKKGHIYGEKDTWAKRKAFIDRESQSWGEVA